MREPIVTEGSVERPVDLAREGGVLGVQGLSAGGSLVVLARDYDVLVTRLDDTDSIGNDAPFIQSPYPLLDNLYVHGATTTGGEDADMPPTRIEWFTSLKQLSRTFAEHEINPHAFALGSVTRKEDYTGPKRANRVISGGLLIPGMAEDLVDARTNGVLAGAMLAPRLVKQEVVNSVNTRMNAQKKRYLMGELSDVLMSVGRVTASFSPEDLDEINERVVNGVLHEELAVSEVHRIGDFFTRDGEYFADGMRRIVGNLTLGLVTVRPNLAAAQRSQPSIEELQAQVPAA